ncbi:homeobox protein Hox-A2a-like [Contarinia nasturtii]|uniref:homeobox protein Hox-A2a-like n=1 Tax=Contarinia nasturtii TaxID=265458 RepID=UPI0012D3B0FC|nr:homeobox protein Hox-A2a-like [Contarinia nasturtii]
MEGTIVDVPLGRGGKPKRVRTQFTPEQIRHLEANFQSNNYPPKPKREELAEMLDLTVRNVVVWFNNRRMLKKKQQMSTVSETQPVQQSPTSVNTMNSREFHEYMPRFEHSAHASMYPDIFKNLTPDEWNAILSADGYDLDMKIW